jgi:ketosteroid isomerase-like protein
MSRENVELVKSLQPPPDADVAALFRDEALATAARDAAAPAFAEDFECFTTVLGRRERRYGGLDGLRTLWLDWLEPWESYRTEIEEMIDAGDHVVVFVRDYGRRRGMTAEVPVVGAAVWTVRGGKVARIGFYPDRMAALEAAGLPE